MRLGFGNMSASSSPGLEVRQAKSFSIRIRGVLDSEFAMRTSSEFAQARPADSGTVIISSLFTSFAAMSESFFAV